MEPIKQIDPLLSIKEVAKALSISHTSVVRLIKKEDFPKPIYIMAQSRRWRASSIDAWIDEQMKKDQPDS